MNPRYLLGVWIVISAGLFVSGAQAAEGGASIHGLLYVSYSGDLSYDVMFASKVEVLLLKGEQGLEREVENLKSTRLPKIQTQEAAAMKAHRELRTPAKDRAKEKERREAFKREVEKLDKLRSEYEKDFRAVLEKYVTQSAKTDADGKFDFKQLSPGRHFLHARYEMPGTVNRYFWLHPVELKEKKEVEVHLNKSATISIY